MRGPFTLAEARSAGLELWHLAGASWRRVGPETYLWKDLRDDPMHRIEAAHRRLPTGAAFSGLTAAWLHGLDFAPCDPIEATVPARAGVSARSGMAIHRSALREDDVVQKRGVPATSLVRTLADLCGRLTLTEAVVIADSALHTRRIRLGDLEAWTLSRPWARGIRNLRRVIRLAEPAAESPMESRLRMLLILGGLPRPRVQVSIHDRSGRFAGRPDLYYEAERLGIEYDGAVHRNSLTSDDQRQNRLLRAGVRLLRFTAPDVLGNPASVVTEVRAMLGSQSDHASAGTNRIEPIPNRVSAGENRKSRRG